MKVKVDAPMAMYIMQLLVELQYTPPPRIDSKEETLERQQCILCHRFHSEMYMELQPGHTPVAVEVHILALPVVF